MGGGDLNLKKSWHPSTLKNIERVWRAEQKHEAEQKKIEQLQRELAEERTRQEMRQYAEGTGVVRKREEKLDWMYQGPAALLNREDYLTGRPIDKAFELLQQSENEKVLTHDDETIPDSIFNSSGAVTVDLVNKIREDPLFHIRKKEEENKKQLLNNPVRMKYLQQLLQREVEKEHKKVKKSSKQKKRKNRDQSSSRERKNHKEYSDHEDLIREKKKSKIHEKHKQVPFVNGHSKRDVNQDDRSYKKHKSERYSRNVSPPYRNKQNGRKHFSSDTSSSENEERHRKHHSKTQNKASDYQVYQKRRSEQEDRQKNSQLQPKEKRRKLTNEEAEKKRQEMMVNAKWRDEQRLKHVTRYLQEDEKEKADESKKGSSADFIRPLLSKTASKITVEDRIKSNIFNIQRSHSHMEKNFAKR